MDEKKVSFESKLTRHDSAEIIDALVAALREGEIKVQKNDEVLFLNIPNVVEVEIEASTGKGKAKFEIELSWPLQEEKQEKKASATVSAKSASNDTDKEHSKGKAKDSAKEAVQSAQTAIKEIGKAFALSGKTAKRVIRETVEATKTAVLDSALAAKEMAGEASKLIHDQKEKHKNKKQEKDYIDVEAKPVNTKEEKPKSLTHAPKQPKKLPSEKSKVKKNTQG